VLAALSEDWEDAHAHAKRAHEVGTYFNPLFGTHLHHGVGALDRGGDEVLAREVARRLAIYQVRRAGETQRSCNATLIGSGDDRGVQR
jgi:hypothetical protein